MTLQPHPLHSSLPSEIAHIADTNPQSDLPLPKTSDRNPHLPPVLSTVFDSAQSLQSTSPTPAAIQHSVLEPETAHSLATLRNKSDSAKNKCGKPDCKNNIGNHCR
jgi:hypothetical protein